jgi:hypothetical protein
MALCEAQIFKLLAEYAHFQTVSRGFSKKAASVAGGAASLRQRFAV